jgi:hypothetical protein
MLHLREIKMKTMEKKKKRYARARAWERYGEIKTNLIITS